MTGACAPRGAAHRAGPLTLWAGQSGTLSHFIYPGVLLQALVSDGPRNETAFGPADAMGVQCFVATGAMYSIGGLAISVSRHWIQYFKRTGSDTLRHGSCTCIDGVSADAARRPARMDVTVWHHRAVQTN